MKKSRVVSNALNNPKAGYSQLARLEPTVFWRRSRRIQLTALEQLSLVLDSKAKNDPHTEKRTLPRTSAPVISGRFHIPTLQHSNTPTLQYSIAPVLHYSVTPLLADRPYSEI